MDYNILPILVCLVQLVEMAKLLDTSVSCDQKDFVLSLSFDSEFRGIVYSEDDYPNCVYVNGTMLPQRNYQLKIPLVGCETRTNEDGNFENAIIVQENSGFVQSTDKKYLLTCIPSTVPVGPQRESLITVDFGGVTIDNSHTTPEVISASLPPDSTKPPLKYTVEIRAGHSSDSPTSFTALNIGDPISYVVKIQKPVANTQISRCWATDAKSNLELSDENGCTLQPRASIWNSFERSSNDEEVIFVNKIKAWAFPTSDEVNIFCNLRVCMSRSCELNNCTTVTKRHRRHFTHPIGAISSVERIHTQIRLRRQAISSMSSTDLVTKSMEDQSKVVCLTTSHLALLASCVLVLLILILVFVFMVTPNKFLHNLKL
ncbi:unnamed protein product [Bursaphelenchus okinawaensis]|uniref:ZP domain-containing protein n=1 Tax=Bursaphelenchus okinawaensis TaxID=465554 RepID=A0A811JTH7_9BILA|nr:unnamed protein product [Bursaphelenchus okinawaensis]CAG9082440.1 unnamed protein product [Bursaphelenchus okinawaensis]